MDCELLIEARAVDALLSALLEVAVKALSCALMLLFTVALSDASFWIRDESSLRMLAAVVGRSLEARLISDSTASKKARRLFALTIVAEVPVGIEEAKADKVVATVVDTFATMLLTEFCNPASWPIIPLRVLSRRYTLLAVTSRRILLLMVYKNQK